MTADASLAWRIAKPTPGAGTRYGTRTAIYLAEDVLGSSSRRSLVRAAAKLAGLAAGDELAWDYAEHVVIDLGDAIGRDDAETHRLWSWARDHATPRRAPTDGRMARPGDVIDRLLDLQARIHADERLHRHRSAGSALKILDAFVLMAIRANRLEFAWSRRQIAEAAGVDVRTVYNSEAAWRRYVNRLRPGSSHRGSSTTWRLVADDAHRSHRPEAIGDGYRGLCEPCASGDLADPSRNYWVRDGHKRAVWMALDDRDPMTPGEVHDAIGGMVHVGTVRRLLHRLDLDGMAVRTADGWVRRLDVDEPPGIDYAARRRERHAAERMTWRTWRATDEENDDTT
jgi:hypothetical protein